MRGPLTQPIGQAGHGCGTHLQRQITEQIEQIERDALHRDILLLPRTDTRRIAWLAVDRLSSQWVPAWPTRTMCRQAMQGLAVWQVGGAAAAWAA